MKLSFLLGLCAALLITAVPAHAATDFYLELDDIEGETTDEQHANQIEVYSFSFGATQATTTTTTGGGGAGKVSFSDLSIMKPLDKSSPKLYLACAQGKHIPRAVLYGRKSGDKPTDYYVITLSDVMISSIQTSGATGGDRPTESISLNFTKIEFSYARQRPDGSYETPVQTGWDIAQNIESRSTQ